MHPKAAIFALGGPIVIGTHCIIEEGTILVNRQASFRCSRAILTDVVYSYRKKEVMRIGDDNLFEIGCRPSSNLGAYIRRLTNGFTLGVESPSIGDFNTISVRSRLHHTVRLSSYCVIGAGCLVVPTEDEVLPDYTVIYGNDCERSTWSGRGKLQEADLRRKHGEYLRDMLPKHLRILSQAGSR